MVLTACFVLSPVTGLSCHRHRRSYLRQLDASVGASGPHDFAVRKSALSSLAPPASTASRPASVTIASRPSSVGRDGKSYSLICISEKQKYFCKGDWTGQSPTRSTDLPVRQIKQPVRQQIAGWVELRETRRGRLDHDGYRFRLPLCELRRTRRDQ